MEDETVRGRHSDPNIHNTAPILPPPPPPPPFRILQSFCTVTKMFSDIETMSSSSDEDETIGDALTYLRFDTLLHATIIERIQTIATAMFKPGINGSDAFSVIVYPEPGTSKTCRAVLLGYKTVRGEWDVFRMTSVEGCEEYALKNLLKSLQAEFKDIVDKKVGCTNRCP